MRDREEIYKEFAERNQYSEFKRHNEQILEVLLDIRSLLQASNEAPQIKVKISEAQEPSTTVADSPHRPRFTNFNKIKY